MDIAFRIQIGKQVFSVFDLLHADFSLHLGLKKADVEFM